MLISQHNQWICLTTKRRAQDFPVEGFIASAQSQITQCLPSTGESVQHKGKHDEVLYRSHILEMYLNVLVQTCFEYTPPLFTQTSGVIPQVLSKTGVACSSQSVPQAASTSPPAVLPFSCCLFVNSDTLTV